MTGHFDRFDRPNLHFDFQLNFTPQCQVNKFWWKFLQRCKNTSHSKTQARQQQQQQPLLNKNLRSQITMPRFANFQSGLVILPFMGWVHHVSEEIKVVFCPYFCGWPARFSNSNSLQMRKKNSYLSATS